MAAAIAHCESSFAPNWPEPGQGWGDDPFGDPFEVTTLGDLEHFLGYRDTAIAVYRLLQSRELERVNPE